MSISSSSSFAFYAASAAVLHKKTVAVVDYGMGNLRSVTQAVHAAAAGSGVDVVWAKTAQDVLQADRVILPGQGAMGDCMMELQQSGMLEALLHAAKNKPLLGVCVGMQMLLDTSQESKNIEATKCLGLISGEVIKFDIAGQLAPDGTRYKVPQMGWNTVHIPQTKTHPIWHQVVDIPTGSYFYFVHSYHVVLNGAQYSVGETDYGQRFVSAIARENLVATQFHPEKSAMQGLALYRNFLHWNP